jgi:hypothetical protein
MKVVLPKVTKKGKTIQNPRTCYSLAQKIALIDLANATGIRITAKNNNIHRNMLQRWMKKENELRLLAMQRGINQYQRTRLTGNGRPPNPTISNSGMVCCNCVVVVLITDIIQDDCCLILVDCR